MSVPLIENIALDIETAINAITGANGFNQDLTALRPRRNDFFDITPEDGLVLIKQADEELADEQFSGAVKWVQVFALMAFVIDSDSASTAIDTRLNQVKADIQKKLLEDPRRSTLALDTILRPAIEFPEDSGVTGITVFVAVEYRINETDPYTQG